jgi:RNA polymerase sigma-70 factor, ECF subfamily
MQTELYTMHGTIAPDDVEAGVTPQPSTALRLDAALGARLHRQAQAARWGLSVASFAAVLERSAGKALGDAAGDRSKVERYLTSLHLEDLALASACVEGIEAAWDHFVLEYRPVLYRSADAIDPGGGARELADSIYADLFGLQERDGERRSLFRYFHGRSSLATWLRAVLAQRQVDRVRSTRRLTALEPFEAQDAPPPPLITSPEPDPDVRRFVALIKVMLLRALSVLRDRDRLRLGCYYRQDLTLAQTGRLLGEHEATVSRQLARSRKAIRTEVERLLKAEAHLTEAEIARCFECTIEDPGSLDVAELFSEVGSRKDPGS